jgi:hypothetical protein
MSSIWTELLFLHGYIADRQLAKRLVTPSTSPSPADPPVPATGSQPDTRHAASPRELIIKLSKRLCLGIGGGMPCMQ